MFLVKQHTPAFVFAHVLAHGVIQYLDLILGEEKGCRGVSFPMFASVGVGDLGREWSCEDPNVPQRGSIL